MRQKDIHNLTLNGMLICIRRITHIVYSSLPVRNLVVHIAGKSTLCILYTTVRPICSKGNDYDLSDMPEEYVWLGKLWDEPTIFGAIVSFFEVGC